jgi:hypothetical protein
MRCVECQDNASKRDISGRCLGRCPDCKSHLVSQGRYNPICYACDKEVNPDVPNQEEGFMRFAKNHWLEIITVTFTAVMIWVAFTHAQDKAIITTSASNAEYPPGSYEDTPSPKPAGANMLRSVLDRKDLTDSKVKVSWQVWYSENGGEYKLWSGASTFGGGTPNPPVSTFGTAAPPEGSLIQNKTTVTGGNAKFGTVLQMWEVR